jgi:hypothetical protein
MNDGKANRWDRAALLTLASSVCVAIIAVTGVLVDNPGEVAPSEIVRPLAVSIAIALVIPALFLAIGDGLRFAAYAFPIAYFAFFKFSGFVGAAQYARLSIDAAFLTAIGGLALVCAACVMSARRCDPVKFTSFFFVVSGLMALGSAATAAFAFLQAEPDGERLADNLAAQSPHPVFKGGELPDIIYIVPDRYGSLDTLHRQFNHDNSGFVAALEARGFYYAPDARANYAKTIVSLASSMNMSGLEPLAAEIDPANVDRRPLYRMIRENAAQRTLRAAGYDYVHLGNWWDPTRRNPHATAHYYGIDTLWSAASEFEKALLRLTPVALFATDGPAAERAECDRLKNQLRYLETVRSQARRPLFVFAHLTMPHEPITMDAEGNCIPHVYYPGSGASWAEYQSAFSGYVNYLNKRLLGIFDANMASDNGRSLIFVVQADEGPYPKRLEQWPDMIMQEFDDTEIRQKFGIINAVYWDAEKYGEPFLTKTPVNNWRIILSKISGDEIPLIEDERSYLMRSDKLVYDNLDVTDVFEARQIDLHASADKGDTQNF